MITVKIKRNENNNIFGFLAENHGDKIVCAAVSALVLNTVNSIEEFTNDEIEYEFTDSGFIDVTLPVIKNGEFSHDTNLLLESLVFGLKAINEEYSKDIKIYDTKNQ